MIAWLNPFLLIAIKTIGIVFEILFSYLAISLILSLIEISPSVVKEKNNTIVYLRSNGVHLELVLPVKTETINWNNKIPFTDTPGNDSTSKFIAFGWGEENFFMQTPTWADFKISNMLKSLFFLGKSAMHITYIKQIYQNKKTIPLKLNKIEYKNLVNSIQNEFVQNKDGSYQLIQQNIYGKHDAFYHAKSAYNLFYTCNSWVNKMLKVAQQKHSIWTPFSYVLFNFYSDKKR